jgi:hypothetical protein
MRTILLWTSAPTASPSASAKVFIAAAKAAAFLFVFLDGKHKCGYYIKNAGNFESAPHFVKKVSALYTHFSYPIIMI